VIRGRFLRLYLVMDVWSRRIVGWDVHDDERAEWAATLIQRICADSGVDPHGLVLHSDNGKPMRGNTMIADLRVAWDCPVLQPTPRVQRQPVL
jgi:putative transposase